jgi:hypothetical protein
MKRAYVISAALVLVALIAVGAFLIINPAPANNKFYVGVTYCGNSVGDAKRLIDKVKNYTNLFVLQSGALQTSNASIDAIGDYAVQSGLDFVVYIGVSSFALGNNWLTGYDGRWGSHLLGVYLDDEPGGKMLDAQAYLTITVLSR